MYHNNSKPFKSALTLLTGLVSCFILLSSCNKDGSFSQLFKSHGQWGNHANNGWENHDPGMVIAWNEAAVYMVQHTPQDAPNPPIPPFVEARYYAMVNLAMHDALNNIVPRYQAYSLHARDVKANPDAAVTQAAFDVINASYGHLNPPAFFTPQEVQDYLQNLYTQTMAAIPDGDAKTRGIALGHAAAQAILQRRANDGIASVMFPVTPGTEPGQYRFTFPFDGPPFNGFYDSPGWGDLQTFGIQSSTQFPVPPPYEINSAAYTQDYNEIKRLGCAGCTGAGGRSPDQENIAKFWVENSPFGWNKIAGQLIQQRHPDAWKVARLFALLQMTEADAYISCLKYKMQFFFWRPVTAVQLGDSDGNPDTQGDPNWQVLWFPTPPVADHPSAHATAGGAASGLMAAFFGKDDMSFTFESSTLPGQPRTYKSLSDASRENALSRIYVGYHFRHASMEGEILGKKIGNWNATHSLQPE